MADALSTDGKHRDPEKHGKYPEHVNPNKGPYEDVHVQTTEAMKKAGFLGVLGSVFAAESQAAAENPNSDAATIGSAAAWDVASALDPIFLTEALQSLFGLSPTDDKAGAEKKRNEEEKKKKECKEEKDKPC